jgi:hypothetical protein
MLFSLETIDRIMSLSLKAQAILVTSACSCLVVGIVITSPLSSFIPQAQAQSRRVRYIPPSNLDAPQTSGAGASRSAIVLIAILPDLQIDKSPVPQTISERPTIYFLTPKHRGSVTFRLRDDKATTPNKFIYEKKFEINNDAGIIAFKLPDDAPTLEVDKIYTWQFTVQTLYSSKFVNGAIRRVLPTRKLTSQLSQMSNPIDRATLFAQESLWFETVATLAEAQRTVPKNSAVSDEWVELLKSAKLDRVLPYSFVSQK